MAKWRPGFSDENSTPFCALFWNFIFEIPPLGLGFWNFKILSLKFSRRDYPRRLKFYLEI
ncbi:hypothetical protein [Campylobacter gracilis]|uniref:Uncharacterized protein n=1 Tax=Campylobacter gracilis RM3268 TaxID=553220 RepID=C8PG42_9BACT|nr:hypothetical protein [Campylobacter gracilis]EEV18080.1 hypothetical protein CAMGR0001_0835 [Campylobacter gracilis RM3268]UEB45173.1 hypothetical protein LK410_09300 [Campylobacter gracilis]